MMISIDARLSPAIAAWIKSNFNVKAFALRDLNLRDAEDEKIFSEARKADAVVLTKDSDFVSLLDRLGAPPKDYLANLRKHFKRQSQNHFTENASRCDQFTKRRRAVS